MAKIVLKKMNLVPGTSATHRVTTEHIEVVDMTNMEFLNKVLKPSIPRSYFLDHPILKLDSFKKKFRDVLSYSWNVDGPSNFISLSFYSDPDFEKVSFKDL